MVITKDLNDNIYVSGRSENSWGGYSHDILTIKYDSDGNLQWSNRYKYGFGTDNQPYAMIVDENENLFITGMVGQYYDPINFVSWGGEVGLIKYDMTGNLIWDTIYNGPGDNFDYGVDITQDSDDNLYVVGNSVGDTSSIDFVTIKFSPLGGILWSQRYNGKENNTDRVASVSLDSNEDIIVAGYAREDGFNTDITILKYSPPGAQQWAAIFDGGLNLDDACADIYIDELNYIYVAGGSESDTTDTDALLLKYNPQGDFQWKDTYNSGGVNSYEYNSKIAVDLNGNMYIAGRTTSLTGANADYLLLKYASPLTYQEEFVPVKVNAKVYPNPMRDQLVIEYELKSNMSVQVNLVDIHGRTLQILVDSEEQQGVHNYTINVDEHVLATGHYLVEFVFDYQRWTRQVIKVD